MRLTAAPFTTISLKSFASLAMAICVLWMSVAFVAHETDYDVSHHHHMCQHYHHVNAALLPHVPALPIWQPHTINSPLERNLPLRFIAVTRQARSPPYNPLI